MNAGIGLIIAPVVAFCLIGIAPARSCRSDQCAPSMSTLPATISPQMRRSLKEAAREGPPPANLHVRRKLFARIQLRDGSLQQRKYPVEIRTGRVSGVPVRIVTPIHRFGNTGLILMNVHGGGFVTDSGSYTENIPIAALTGIPVVAVLYRLAPEHRYPSAVDDALAVYRYLLKAHRADEIGVYGTSAGAILGPELMMRLRKEKLPLPAVLGVFAGDADLARPGYSALSAERSGEINLKQIFDRYVPTSERAHPLVSPLYGDLHFFPPTLCITSTADFLLSGTVNFCRKLDASGVDARLVVFDGLPHAFWAYLAGPESDEAFGVMAEFLRSRLRVGKPDERAE